MIKVLHLLQWQQTLHLLLASIGEFFVILMIHTGMMGMVVITITGNRESDIKSIASVLNEIGVGGLNIEVATYNEGYLKDLMAKGLTKSNMRSFHWRNISEYRPQAKGIERAVGIAKEGIYTNWLAFEEHCQCRIALESPLLGYLITDRTCGKGVARDDGSCLLSQLSTTSHFRSGTSVD